MSDYIVHDTSLTAVADAIRTQTGRSGALEFPTQFASEINSLALKRGVLRHDAELIHTVSYDQMLVADEGVTIPAYTTSETKILDTENLSPGIILDFDSYDYRVILKTLTIPIYDEQTVHGPYWNEYYIMTAVYDINAVPPLTFKGISTDEYASNRSLTTNAAAVGRMILWDKNGDDLTASTSATYGVRQSGSSPGFSGASTLILKRPFVYIRGATSNCPQDCWEAIEDVRLQYVFDVYRAPKGNLNLDGWGMLQNIEAIADCVNSADHKLR